MFNNKMRNAQLAYVSTLIYNNLIFSWSSATFLTYTLVNAYHILLKSSHEYNKIFILQLYHKNTITLLLILQNLCVTTKLTIKHIETIFERSKLFVISPKPEEVPSFSVRDVLVLLLPFVECLSSLSLLL